MARGCPEAARVVQTREDEVEDLGAREGVRAAQEMQGSQAPVEAVEAQMFGEPVLELVFALERVSAGREPGGRAASQQLRTVSRLWM